MSSKYQQVYKKMHVFIYWLTLLLLTVTQFSSASSTFYEALFMENPAWRCCVPDVCAAVLMKPNSKNLLLLLSPLLSSILTSLPNLLKKKKPLTKDTNYGRGTDWQRIKNRTQKGNVSLLVRSLFTRLLPPPSLSLPAFLLLCRRAWWRGASETRLVFS